MPDRPPLLSICIPTCNRAGFLKVMLQALLPQVREVGDEVEVWVLDNASTDGTNLILEEAGKFCPFFVHRQTENLGPTRNIVHGPSQLARGEYVWVLGDHNLLRPNALQKVLAFIRSNRSFGSMYVNFRCAAYPDHWPESAWNGYEGDFTYLGNPELSATPVDRWTDLLRPYSSACTQNYAHIVRTSVWREYWTGRSTVGDYTNAITTYPHTVTLLHSIGHLPAAVINEPMITIFNGAQSWGNPKTRFRVYFLGLTDLLSEFSKNGVPQSQLHELREFFFYKEASRLVRDAYRQLGRIKTLKLFLRCSRLNWCSFRVFLYTLPEGLFPRTVNMLQSVRRELQQYRSFYIYNFRPARWLRSRGWLKW